jgi:hypothetical protein
MKKNRFLILEVLLFILIVVFAMKTGVQDTYANLTELYTIGTSPWSKLATSDDGNSIVLLRDGGGYSIFVSTDGGSSGFDTGENRSIWVDVYEASNGFVAVSNSSGDYVYNYSGGGSWSPDTDESSPRGPFVAVAMSDNGDQIVMTGGSYYRKSGGVWGSYLNSSGNGWVDVAISGNGQYSLLAAQGANGKLFISTDVGNNLVDTNAGDSWIEVAISYTGQYMVALKEARTAVFSNDYGATWSNLEGLNNITGIDVSENGKIVVTVEAEGMFYAFDYGQGYANWIYIYGSYNKNWTDVKISSNGAKIYGTATSDYVYSYDLDITPPSLSGGSPSGILSSDTTTSNMEITTDENATCKYSINSGVTYDSMSNVFGTTGETFHIDYLSALTPGNYTYNVRCADAFGNKNTEDYSISFTIEQPEAADTTPPVILDLSPSGTLAEGTVNVNLQVATDENSTCKYSSNSESYDFMASNFNTTGYTSHSTNISVSANTSYTFYVRCSDSAGNRNTFDTTTTFYIPANIAPTITTIDSTKSNGTYGIGEVIDINLEFSEPVNSSGLTINLSSGGSCVISSLFNETSASCNYTVQSGENTDDLNATISGTITDGADNSNSSITPNINLSESKDIIIDTAAPIISKVSPSSTLPSGTSSTTIEISTNESATCRYSNDPGVDYDSMTSPLIDGSTIHSYNVTGLTDGGNYDYYIKCIDELGNKNSSDYQISFSVDEPAPPDTTPPTILNITSDKPNGTYGIGEVIDIDIVFNEVVSSIGDVTITLETGDIDRTCLFSVTNSSTATCNYTVQTGDTSSDLNVLSVSGAIEDTSSNAMVDFTPATNLAANKNIVINTSISNDEDEGEEFVEEQGTPKKKGSIIQNVSNTFATTLSRSVSKINNLFSDFVKTVQQEPENESKIRDLVDMLRQEFSKLLASGEVGMTPLNQNSTQKFAMDLEFGDLNEDVRLLQQFLNNNGYIVAETGPGSIGNETTMFGTATRAALSRFQKDNNIVPSVGYFGPVTRNLINNFN